MTERREQTILSLEAGSEWRFELEADEEVAVRVSGRLWLEYVGWYPSNSLGHARVQTPEPVYINSEELPPSTWYPLHRHLKGSLYFSTSSQIEVTSLPTSQYTSTSTTQPSLISLHLALERIRILSKRRLFSSHPNEGTTRGPRVMVVGPSSSGKSTIVKNLVNLALGSGMNWRVGVAGLDPTSPSNLIPGSLSLSTPTHPLPTHHLAHPLGSPPTSLPSSSLAADVSTLGWWYGSTEPSNKGAEIWRKLVDQMGLRWQERCEKDPMAMASGLIVDTSSAFTNATLGTKKDDPKARYTLVEHAVHAFGIDILVIVGPEKLHLALAKLFPELQVIRLPQSGGVVDLDDAYIQTVHSSQIRSYFYGEPPFSLDLSSASKITARENSLTPYSFQIGWETLKIYRVGEENAAPSSALPLGSSRILSPTRLTRVDPGGPAHVVRLLNTVLAVVNLVPEDKIVSDKEIVKGEAKEEIGDEDEDDEVPYKEEIGWREVLGFIVITAIDAQRKKYTVLSPSPGKLPSTVALAGNIEWVDSGI
ncbi:polyribonucleotide 5'-hydroxyl-kinase, partial [Tremellales sp. Uapishka_1]